MAENLKPRVVGVRVARCALYIILAAGAAQLPCHGQWMAQRIDLNPGWNAVFLNVDPEIGDCDSVFAGTGVAQVCAYNDTFATVQFTVDTNSVVPSNANWLKWQPSTNSPASTRDLFQLRGGKAYLIQLNPGPATNLVLVGKPALRKVEWRDGSYNLVGFTVRSNSPPSFASFFAPSPQHTTQTVYRLVGASWTAINPTNTMRSGEAFWIRCNGASEYQGPVELVSVDRDGLNYGNTLLENALTVRNHGSNAVTVEIRALNSTASPIASRAGDVPISWWDPDLNTLGGWRLFPSTNLTAIQSTVASNADGVVRFAVRRADLAPFQPPPGELGRYVSLLEVTDSMGGRKVIPVTALGLVLPQDGAVTRRTHAGLWAGDVVIQKVSQTIGYTTQVGHSPSNPVPVGVGGEYQFRLLWHLDTNLVARILPECCIVWVNGTYSTNVQGIATNTQPGRYVLVTGTNLPSQFSSSDLSSDASLGRRLTATTFGMEGPVVMARGSNAAVNTFACALTNRADDALNPFKHLYHKDHKDGGLSVTRNVSMEFLDLDSATVAQPEWGDTLLGGVWREQVTGLRHETIYVEGRYLLRKVADVGVLNDQH
jgi:hypothetical protein